MKKYEAPDFTLLILAYPESILLSDWVNPNGSDGGDGEGSDAGKGQDDGWSWDP